MKALVTGALLEALQAKTARMRERTKTLIWWRDLAKSSANKNGLPMTDQQLDYGDKEGQIAALMSIYNELANKTDGQSAPVVQGSGEPARRAEGSVPASSGQAEPSQVGQQGGGFGQGSTGQSTSVTVVPSRSFPATNPVPAGRCEDSTARSLWRTALPYILSGIGFVGGGGTLGYAVSQYFQSSVSEGELLPYIEENGWHLPPKPKAEKAKDG